MNSASFVFAARLLPAALVFWVAMPPAHAEDSAGAEVVCTQGDKARSYACTLVLKGNDSARPIQGAAVFTGADAPDREFRSVKAQPTGKAGEYRFNVELEADGDWSLKVRLAKPRQDLIIHKMISRKPAN